MTGECIFEKIYFVFPSFPQKEERTPAHIAAHLQAPQTIAQTKAYKRAVILLTHPC